ncbi:hypothetical protein HDV06_001935 [Boothiomyces sp. JEL0866]|nr:hypothetical protein HDV06_001935 [Boothiomyces sp. JEL0866]
MEPEKEYHKLLDLLQLVLTNEVITEIVELYDKLVSIAAPKTVFAITNKILVKTKFDSACPLTHLIARHLPKLLDFSTHAMRSEGGLSIYHYFLTNLFKFKGIDFYISDFLQRSENEKVKIGIGLEYIKSCFGLNIDLDFINRVVANQLQDLECHSLLHIVVVYGNLFLQEEFVDMVPTLLKAIVDVWYVKYIMKSERFSRREDWSPLVDSFQSEAVGPEFHDSCYYVTQFTCMVSILSTKYESLILDQLLCIPMFIETVTELSKSVFPNISLYEREYRSQLEEQFIVIQSAASYLKVMLLRSPHFSKTNNSILDKFIPLDIFSEPNAIRRKFCNQRYYLTPTTEVIEEKKTLSFDFRYSAELYQLYILCLDLKTTFEYRRITIKEYPYVAHAWDELFGLLTLSIIKQTKFSMGKHLLLVIIEAVLAFLEFCGDTDLMHFLIDPPFVERAFKILIHFWNGRYFGKLLSKMIEYSVPWASKFGKSNEEYRIDELDMSITSLLVIFQLVLCTSTKQPITLPIARSKSNVRAANGQSSLARFSGRDDASSLPIANNYDSFYQANVTIGSGQTFLVDLDTGSSDFWLRGPKCDSEDWSCIGAEVQLPDSKINSLGKSFSINYGAGSSFVNGDIYTTDVKLGNSIAKGLPFGIVESNLGISTKEEGFTGITGLLGLAFDSLSEISNVTGRSASFFDSLGFTGDSNKFSFYLSEFLDGDSGEITIGGVDQTKFTGPINYVPLAGETWWKFDISTVTYSVGSKSGSLSSKKYPTSTAISDTGTTLIIFPQDVADAINKEIGADPFDTSDYPIDCAIRNTGPLIHLKFPTFTLTIPPKFYVIAYPSGRDCYSAITRGAGGRIPIVFGDPLTRAYYTVYDKQNLQVGFAQAIHPKPLKPKKTLASPVQSPATIPVSKPKTALLGHTSSIKAAKVRFNKESSTPLENRYDKFFQANVTIGASQTFKIDLDTGSSDFWVRGPNCKSDDWSCIGKKVTLPDSSLASLGKQFSTEYGSGSVTADIYTTDVRIGNVVAQNLPFGISTKEASFMGITGLLGLGFNSISDISNATGRSASFFDAVGYTGENNKFSFYLSLYGDNDNGEVTFGGVDQTKFTGPINYVPLTGETWWKFDFSQVIYSVGSITGPASSKKYSTDAISDTGTTLIILGADVADAINKEIGASPYDSDSGTYSIDCSIQNTGKPLNFKFPNFTITIPAKYYVISDYDSNCISAITQGAGPRVPNVL